ncbi:MAG: BREX-2 system adenine-specific DNA-methyltransferase PglX, partial [Bradyrhizobiaceae bacterium]|nr:BREX-2 system adenine-specific DNA-methyltransferase PglX [Bradyrhizobiaceae bacterium]
MIEPKNLLSGLQRLIKKLEDDLRRRCREVDEIDARVRTEYNRAKEAERIAAVYEVWRDEFITQAAVAWVLGCVFVRFIEDNNLVKTPRLAGPTNPENRLQAARDQHTLYFRKYPTHSDREYLEYVFREAARLPAVKDIFDERHNPLWLLGVSGDGATMLIEFWQKVDPTTGDLIHDFTDPALNTRFLGDLYQDLSEAARKKYALLQTPIFVEEFILDRTLMPAIDEFGFKDVRLIDPTCGSGHFLLGAFERLFAMWQKYEPGTLPRKLVQNALDSVYGVDLNPFAVAIARFRLLIAALKACEETSLENAPGFEINLAVGDSLLHGMPPSGSADQLLMTWHPLAHYYQAEDEAALNRILQRNHYHAVVGNPPYITVKDAKLNAQYRERFGSCHRQYSLAVPFAERFFDLAINCSNGDRQESAGFVGMITANSFMKREFGKKLIERYIPRWDLTQVIDTSGAYIPGHGTPTVILFGRNQEPVLKTIRTVMGIKGEPMTPGNPANGVVWMAIINQLDMPDSQSEYISTSDIAREIFHQHPWSIGGGGASDLKEFLDSSDKNRLEVSVELPIGRAVRIGEEDVFIFNIPRMRYSKANRDEFRGYLLGEAVRDWTLYCEWWVWYPYTSEAKNSVALRELWYWRTLLANRATFSGIMADAGLSWFDYMQHTASAYRTSLSITFAEVATHNHFVLDRGGKVFKQTAPVIKLTEDSTEDDHLALVGLLNSSTACFWMKQVYQNKGSTVDERGARQRTMPFEDFYQHSGTGLKQFPVPIDKPLQLACVLDRLARQLQSRLPAALAESCVPNAEAWKRTEAEAAHLREQMIAWQEELDWQCYQLYGLTEETLFGVPPSDGQLEGQSPPPEGGTPNVSVPGIRLGERAFEIVMARKMAAGELETTWFERHGSTPITELPAHWPEDYKQLVERRIELIESDHNINLIERPEFKRRWNLEPWEVQAERALRNWLLDRLEDARYWLEVALTSTARLADRVRADGEFRQVAEMYRGRADFDLTKLVTELVADESVPFLPVFRYKPTGLEKRVLWERTWELQRREDKTREAIEEEYRQLIAKKPDNELKLEDFEPDIRKRVAEAVGEIPVPPKYASKDFQSATYWRLRGKLDVPKERFISYPKCERETDTSPVIAWAGWDHLQQAQAIAGYYELMRTNEGWSPDRLTPLLAGLLELIPWLKQWHNDLDPAYGVGMGDFFEEFVHGEARALGKTIDAI